MTVKEALHQIVESLSDEDARELLDNLNMRADPDELAPEEFAELTAIEEHDHQPWATQMKDLLREIVRGTYPLNSWR